MRVRIGDGYEGWPDRGAFRCDSPHRGASGACSQPLLDQLKIGGRLVAPVGRKEQDLVRITRTEKGFDREVIARGAVRSDDRQGPARLDRVMPRLALAP